MMKPAAEILNTPVHCTDKPLGKIYDLFFDDQDWTVRYVLVRLDDDDGYAVLSTVAFSAQRPEKEPWHVDFPIEKIRNSPAFRETTELPRKEEMAVIARFHWPSYWADAPRLKGTTRKRMPASTSISAEAEKISPPQLRTLRDLQRHNIKAQNDSPAGTISDVIVETTDWSICYLCIRIKEKDSPVLMPPDWIERIDWKTKQMNIDLTVEAVQTSPTWKDS